MSIAVVNPVRRVLGDVSTNALLGPSRHQSAKDSSGKEDIMREYDATMHSNSTVTAGRKRSIDEVDCCDQNGGSFTTGRLSTLEACVDELQPYGQQSKQLSTNTSSKGVIAEHPSGAALQGDRSNMAEGSQISGDDGILMEVATDIDIDTSPEDHVPSTIAPALKKHRKELDAARDVSDSEKDYTRKMAARVYDRISRAARLYEEKEAKKELRAQQKTELRKAMEAPKRPHHPVVPHQIITGAIGRKVSTSALLPAPDIRPSSSRSSGSAVAADYTGGLSYENNDDRIYSEREDPEASTSANESRRPESHESTTHGELGPPILERAAATSERGLAIDGLLKLMETTTNYDRIFTTN